MMFCAAWAATNAAMERALPLISSASNPSKEMMQPCQTVLRHDAARCGARFSAAMLTTNTASAASSPKTGQQIVHRDSPLIAFSSGSAISFSSSASSSRLTSPRGEEVVDHVEQTAFEQPVHEVVRHAAGDILFGDLRRIDESAAVHPVPDEGAGLHFSKHRGDGGVGEVRVAAEVFEHLGDGGFAALPEGLHDAQLKVAEAVDAMRLHARAVLTTVVILLW